MGRCLAITTLVLCASISFAQTQAPANRKVRLADTAGYWFTEREAVNIANGIHRLKVRDTLQRQLIDSLHGLSREQAGRLSLNADMLVLAAKQLDRYGLIQKSLESENGRLRREAVRKWTESPLLWMAIGASLVFAIRIL